MISKNQEKKFSVLAIASITENCLLTDPNEVFELCSFITGEEVDLSNISRFAFTIKQYIYEQYPEFKKTIVDQSLDMTMEKTNLYQIKLYYTKHFGKKLLIKSLRKCMYKELKLTR